MPKNTSRSIPREEEIQPGTHEAERGQQCAESSVGVSL
jgi:hypothetical protein